ncbi:MAG: D-tyrosyl-tRNA(Tyr) deacylase [Calditrichaeota bacterium]|nr:MAG: D-tyrosyl-tRNA(Tyr) deacylase [Calditrichota bacterium]
MKAVIQRVREASVEVDGKVIGEIEKGLVVLLGVGNEDEKADAEYLAEKIANLRIFGDEEDKMNLSIRDVGGGILAISQFTLYASTRKGRRPSFTHAAPPEKAVPLYEYFMECLQKLDIPVSSGEFGAMMLVKIFNDGPVTIIMDSQDRFKPRKGNE